MELQFSKTHFLVSLLQPEVEMKVVCFNLNPVLVMGFMASAFDRKCPWKIECFLEDLFLGSQRSIILGYRRLSVKYFQLQAIFFEAIHARFTKKTDSFWLTSLSLSFQQLRLNIHSVIAMKLL